MAQIAFLNERSYPRGDIHVDIARGIIDDFFKLLVELRKILPAVSLVSETGVLNLSIGDNYSIARWLNHTQKEHRQFMLSLAQLAPFRAVRDQLGDRDPGATVYKFNGEPFDGLTLEAIGLADMYGGIGVSFAADARWKRRFVPVVANQLTDEGEASFTKEVEHGACGADVIFHRPWLLTLPRKDVRDSATLWRDRHDALPHLEFLDAVEADLRGLERRAFMQVVTWLGRMNDAVALWKPLDEATPQYPPHTTGEGEERSRYFMITYKNDVRCFHMHGRFTPGAGRIHFWLSAAERKVVIGYIGQKVFAKLMR